MKAIMISIQSQHCENILNLIKTLEIRKSCPKEWKKYLSGKTRVKPEPVKVYIYETKGREFPFNVKIDTIANDNNSGFLDCKRGMPPIRTRVNNKGQEIPYLAYGRAKVVACFTLNEVEKFDVPYPSYFYEVEEKLKPITQGSCLTLMQLHHYLKNKTAYAWHIDDLQIYGTPKELSKFKKQNFCYKPMSYEDIGCFEGGCVIYELGECDGRCSSLTRPPQSWCYCEELEENNV